MNIEIEEKVLQKRTSGWKDVDDAFDLPDECIYAKDWAQHGVGKGDRWADAEDGNDWGAPDVHHWDARPDDRPEDESSLKVSTTARRVPRTLSIRTSWIIRRT